MPSETRTEAHPVVNVAPYLSLEGPTNVGPWVVAPAKDYSGPWLSPKLEESTRLFLDAFRTPDDEPVTNPSLIFRGSDGVDGAEPSRSEARALINALSFGTIHQNPRWEPEQATLGWGVATTENADIWFQPIDVTERRIVQERGTRMRSRLAGQRLTDPDLRIPAPLELYLPPKVRLDELLVDATYKVLVDQTEDATAPATRVRAAIRWLAKSWHNSHGIDPDDRLLYLHVAIEALTGTSGYASHEELRKIFEQATSQFGGAIGLDDLLWSPNEPMVEHSWTTPGGKVKRKMKPLIEHWAVALAAERNLVVHEGRLSTQDYELDGSPYSGPLLAVGDRIVREAIAVLVGSLGYPDAWRSGISRASLQALRSLE